MIDLNSVVGFVYWGDEWQNLVECDRLLHEAVHAWLEDPIDKSGLTVGWGTANVRLPESLLLNVRADQHGCLRPINLRHAEVEQDDLEHFPVAFLDVFGSLLNFLKSFSATLGILS